MTDLPPRLHLIPYGEDLAPVLAQRLAERFGQRLPDLSDGIVLLPVTGSATGLRRDLLAEFAGRGHDALLGPVITTLREWVEQSVPHPQPVADRTISELLLVEALQGHTRVFGEQDPWRIADSLIPLFDELTLHQISVADTAEAFQEQLRQAYGVTGSVPPPLGREAAIVHRLWQAWREQLQAEGYLDTTTAYLYKLREVCNHLPEHAQLFLVGHLHAAAAEYALLRELLDMGRLEIILQGGAGATGMHPDAPVTALLQRLDLAAPDAAGLRPYESVLNAVYPDAEQPPDARAAAVRQAFPDSPVHGRLTILAAEHAEQEAQAIDLQVRRWLLDDVQPIGVVTDDRKLARRLRALLERAGLPLQDMGGWALSTTSAAATVERWLETIEEDFHHEPLLDLLKSPFLTANRDRDPYLMAVYRLEQDLILHENVPRGLDRYRRHLHYRSKRLQAWPGSTQRQVAELLDLLEQAAAPLREIHTGLHPAWHLLEKLRQSLEILGLWDALQRDPAGEQLLQQWRVLHTAARRRPIAMNWLDFRTWLGRCLETHNFKPAQPTGAVQLLTLPQCRFARFAGVIVAAADQQHLPGPGALSPFFNNRVRAELKLPTRREQLQRRLHEFHSVLTCAPRVLVTWRQSENGEPQSPSPWLEAVQEFHRLAYADNLADRELRQLLNRPESRVRTQQPAPLPMPAARPAPALPGSLRPQRLSATAHQRLIDCPYQFFAAEGLRLAAPETIKTMLEKSDYGERVHCCLQAFHSDVPGLPGPFDEPITDSNRQRAIGVLMEISSAVFAQDLEDNFMHRGWLKRWQSLIPSYIDWQYRRQQQWRVQETEAKRKRQLSPTLLLKGRLDRVDTGARATAIIDYKTGGVPEQEDIDHGEAVQLPSYALLYERPVERVEYLQLGPDKVTTGGALEGTQLDALQAAVATRLIGLVQALDQGSPMPAWGDDRTCSRCDMAGLCRRGLWVDAAEDPNHLG